MADLSMERTSVVEHFNETVVSKRTSLWKSSSATKKVPAEKQGRWGVQLGQEKPETTWLMALHIQHHGADTGSRERNVSRVSMSTHGEIHLENTPNPHRATTQCQSHSHSLNFHQLELCVQILKKLSVAVDRLEVMFCSKSARTPTFLK